MLAQSRKPNAAFTEATYEHIEYDCMQITYGNA